MPARYTPKQWEHNQYAVEFWLRRAMEDHPWLVDDPAKADLIFGAANFSMWCVAGKTFSRRRLWDAVFLPKPGAKSPIPAASKGTPIFIAKQYEGACGPADFTKPAPRNVIMLQEEVKAEEALHTHLVSPFLVSKPPWLVGEAPLPSEPPPWHARKSIFFAGHVPKPYIRDTRYTLWRQLRNDRRATVLSPTLYCTVGGFEACRRSDNFLKAQNVSFFVKFCRHACDAQMNLGGSSRSVRTSCLSTSREEPKNKPFLYSELKGKCKNGYVGVNYTDELADMRRDSRRLPHPEYLALAMSHRFCLVAPGDFVSTHKVSEAMALGGAGGCIPVFVLPVAAGTPVEGGAINVARTLPYTRWLDYCEVAYFVPESNAREAMGDVLDQLEARPAAELQAKRDKLREVRDAFTFRARPSRAGARDVRPTATDFIFAEACAAARSVRASSSSLSQQQQQQQQPEQGRTLAPAPPPSPLEAGTVKGGNHSRCVLMGKIPKSAGWPLARGGTKPIKPRRARRTRLAGTADRPVGGVVRGGYRFLHERGY